MRLLIISGRSGSGKSTALNVLEDIGFTCIDNLPASLLPTLIRQVRSHGEKDENSYAVSIDARNDQDDLQEFPDFVVALRQQGLDCELLYFDADEGTLLKRFSETRRKHPLTDDQTDLRAAIDQESELLAPIASIADLTIDSSHLSLHQLRDLVKKRVAGRESPGMAVLLQSFGFKHGPANDCDLVFDVRCLPNPHWNQSLRALTGQDEAVAEFLSGHEDVRDMLDDIESYLQRWLPKFADDNRSYMTIGIGCTGGQHRSVFIAEQLHQRIEATFNNVQLRHRELRK
ncbi:RNase adapter RapZ [uncultured Pseudoteredinibacter sp.]|uniref:RNase adapter RapZ n=1 Tax=uncultured Pseudoteredinibacter sp. TaxID=1641701 RepID=UPI00262D559D|nr:RNase adapter RapZ [uncultured Pseudoteredinibacter sp.]